jgi:hypothetical protein
MRSKMDARGSQEAKGKMSAYLVSGHLGKGGAKGLHSLAKSYPMRQGTVVRGYLTLKLHIRSAKHKTTVFFLRPVISHRPE